MMFKCSTKSTATAVGIEKFAETFYVGMSVHDGKWYASTEYAKVARLDCLDIEQIKVVEMSA